MNSSRHRPATRALLAILAVLGTAALFGALVPGTGSAEAVTRESPRASTSSLLAQPLLAAAAGRPQTDGADFDPGLIISDYNFFNSDAMTAEQVQDFLAAVPCRPRDDSPCLRDYTQDTTTQPAVDEDGHCAAYEGARDESAAEIITKVAQACGVSPRVLLVLLQKEQSLVTRPNASGYLRATGYGCPDTADCDTDYFGFFNQVYHAAWQFRQYTQHPDRAFHVGTVPVGFHPNAACGSTDVEIRNQATANLYNYTPYQPNAAALDDLEGEGDACSAHGNLNFWLLYSRWFGEPTTAPYPTIFGGCANLVGGQACRPAEWIGDAAA